MFLLTLDVKKIWFAFDKMAPIRMMHLVGRHICTQIRN